MNQNIGDAFFPQQNPQRQEENILTTSTTEGLKFGHSHMIYDQSNVYVKVSERK